MDRQVGVADPDKTEVDPQQLKCQSANGYGSSRAARCSLDQERKVVADRVLHCWDHLKHSKSE